ncbi:hypothetical protein ZWY2020_025639 [Hordeum vulgare]|nr:hypothetical protein ZWY2020_025639 [Hordeum vulgare]
MATSSERASAVADRAATAVEMATTTIVMAATNAESARASVHAADVTLARVEAIHTKIGDALGNIFQATSESSMQPMSEKAVEAMQQLLPHEIIDWELEIHEAAKIEKRREEELCVAEDDVVKCQFVEESVVEYQDEI